MNYKEILEMACLRWEWVTKDNYDLAQMVLLFRLFTSNLHYYDIDNCGRLNLGQTLPTQNKVHKVLHVILNIFQ